MRRILDARPCRSQPQRKMKPTPCLQPTLWRTCRVLANSSRLAILRLLFDEPELSVSAIAERLGMTLARASLSLRALEARGLLLARREGRRVFYRPATPSRPELEELLPALRKALSSDSESFEKVSKLATAFTHPRRVELFRILHDAGVRERTFGRLKARSKMSAWALQRHLAKLQRRGLVTSGDGLYAVNEGVAGFGHVLARLAAAG